MKKLIFIAAFLWLNVANAQSLTRETPEPVTIDTLSSLNYSKGFRLVDGEWLEFDRISEEKFGKDLGFNAIPTQFFFFDDLGYSEYSLSRSINFKHLKILKVNYKSQNFFVLNILRFTGKYKYPNISRDWYEFQEDRFIVLNEEEFVKFKSSFPEKINGAYRFSFSILNDKTFRSDLDDFTLEKKLRLTLDSELSKYSTPVLLFDLFPIDFEGQKIVRFNYKVTSSYSETFDGFKPEDFDSFYFEAPWVQFESFLK